MKVVIYATDHGEFRTSVRITLAHLLQNLLDKNNSETTYELLYIKHMSGFYVRVKLELS